MTPRQMVSELDRFVIGQGDAKKAVAIAWSNFLFVFLFFCVSLCTNKILKKNPF